MGKRSKKKRNRPAEAKVEASAQRADTPPRRAVAIYVLIALAAAAVAAFVGLRGDSGASAERFATQSIAAGALRGYNLLWISLDTVRADYLGSYGASGGFTPHLDQLASEGIRFDDFQAHVPLTLPAHTSLFSARLPLSHGVHDNGTFRVDAGLPTLATTLSAAGYRTGAFVGAFVLDARFGLTQGFDVYDDYYGEKRSFLSFTQLERRADAVIAPAEAFIADNADEPWFAWIHLFDAHAPYDPPPEFRAKFPESPYGGEIAFVDDRVGKLLAMLDESGELDRTLVVILGDHGESLGDHGERTHGAFAYGSTLHVPCILWARGAIGPQVFPGLARQVDITPTLLDLLGVSLGGEVDGQSLRPYLSGEKPYEAPPLYFEALNPHLTQDWAPLRGVVVDHYKLIQLPIPELYDLEHDPKETQNLFESEPERARELQATLGALVGDSKIARPEAPDAETMQQLAALGYVVAPSSERRTDYTEADDPKRLIGLINSYEDAKDLFYQGRREEAVKLLENLIARRPQSSQAYQALAYTLHQSGRVPDAIALLERGLQAGVQDISLEYLLSAYLLEVNDVAKARTLLEDLVRREPSYAEAHNYLGVAYSRLGRFEDARIEFERVIALDPSSATTYNNLGSLFLSRGETNEALGYFERALEFDPDLASAHNGIGVCRARLGDMASAIGAWKRTVELNPQQWDALYNLAFSLMDDSPGEALPYMRRYVAEAPPHRYGPDIEKARGALRQLERRTSGGESGAPHP